MKKYHTGSEKVEDCRPSYCIYPSRGMIIFIKIIILDSMNPRIFFCAPSLGLAEILFCFVCARLAHGSVSGVGKNHHVVLFAEADQNFRHFE